MWWCSRFVARDALGSSGQSMGFLAPVPQDAVVYGSGESAVILTRVSSLPILPMQKRFNPFLSIRVAIRRLSCEV